MIVLGFDPGAWVGYALVDIGPRVPVLLRAGKLRYDRDRSEVSGQELLEQALGEPRSVDLVAIEKVVQVYPRQGFSTPMATAIANATRIEGRLFEAARTKNLETSGATAKEWRYAITGLISPSDAAIKSVLSRRVTIAPGERMSAHARDALGVSLYCGMRLTIQKSMVSSKHSDAGT